ncbi:hypothetical protein [Streptomyces sp900105755]|uniref:Uncharacterized protein n=1 Tax=Streptomyces sp. 900105755 TaxID=3154389 RepID=A0ABV1TVE9_9ACTN
MTSRDEVPPDTDTDTADEDNATPAPEEAWPNGGRSGRRKRLLTLGATLALSVLVIQFAHSGPTKTHPAAQAKNITHSAVPTAAGTPAPHPSPSTTLSATPKATPSRKAAKASPSPSASASDADSAGDWPYDYQVGRVQTECNSIAGCMSTATIKFTNMDSVSHTFYYEYQGIDASGTIVYEGATSTDELDPGRSQKDQMVASDDTDPTNKVVRIEVSSVTVDSPY